MTVDEANAEIDAMIEAMRNPDFSEALNQVRNGLVQQTEDSFSESVDPDGEPWEPLGYRTSGGPPLVLTGELAKSAVDEAMSAAISGNELKTDGSQLVHYAANMNYEEYFSPTLYVGWVAYNPPYPTVVKKRISWHPAREFIGFGDPLVDQSVEWGLDWIVESVVSA